MATHAMHEDQSPALALPRWLIVGFISGAVSVLLFHQGAAALLYRRTKGKGWRQVRRALDDM